MIANATQTRETAALTWVVIRRMDYDPTHQAPAAPDPDHEYLWRPVASPMVDVMVLLDAVRDEQCQVPPRVMAACAARERSDARLCTTCHGRCYLIDDAGREMWCPGECRHTG